jgi:6-phosphogluconate dehydrogenase
LVSSVWPSWARTSALNIADHGFAISVYNRTTAKTDEFVKEKP